MDKNAIKKYAVWARRELISRVSQKALQYGIAEENIIPADSATVNGVVLSNEEKKQRRALIEKINDKGYQQVMEEVAYTWFNRFIALRFMEVNGYLPSHVRVFTDDENNFKPQILTEAINLDFGGLNMDKVYKMKDTNDNEVLFKYLLIVQCNALNPIMPRMFQKISDYTELLFPDNLLREGSVVQQMIELIPEEDWKDAVQIIGWLYQFYNIEPKADVFAKKSGKITKEEIPAATQLFTPDWIVRYMVENSLGRLWVEGHPNDELKTEWKYYLEEAEQEEDVWAKLTDIRKEYASITPEQIKCIDPCVGSGHILAYMFDVLMQIYEAYGYTAREAVGSIVENNIYGLDIDDRAAQLAYFSVMMKARQYDRRFFNHKDDDGKLSVPQPNVFAIIESNDIDMFSLDYFVNGDSRLKESMKSIIKEMHDAKEYGSTLNITPVDYELLYTRLGEVRDDISMSREIVLNNILPMVRISEILTQKYHVVVTNPPYMGSGNMGEILAKFVKKRYPDSKSDLFAVFMERCNQMTLPNCYQAMITQHVWMFLSSFEKLRKKIQKNNIVNMAHLGPRAFEEIGGEVVQTTSFVLRKSFIPEYAGLFIRMIDANTPAEKQDIFRSKRNRFTMSGKNMAMIPGSPIAYTLSEKIMNTFELPTVSSISESRCGMNTGDNDNFLRYWFEVDNTKLALTCKTTEEFMETNALYTWYNKGGTYRKWYGNLEYVIKFDALHYNILLLQGNHLPSRQFYFRECITWTDMSTKGVAFRYEPVGTVFDGCAATAFVDENKLKYLLGILNSTLVATLSQVLNPTLHFKLGDYAKIPYIYSSKYSKTVETLVENNISLSKTDWNNFEYSNEFQSHPLVNVIPKGGVMFERNNIYLSECYQIWENECTEHYLCLKKNEEELNRIIIDIYGLQNELSPEIKDKEITINLADQKRDVKSLISYAVGCMFGRYSLDIPGLAYAGGDWDDSKYISFKADKDSIIPICDDEYFEDDIVNRFVRFIEVVYGKQSLEGNLQFIAEALGGTGQPRDVIRKYFMNDFYVDHLKIYQKRPIYWLFDSGKKNGFKALVYMHRYQPDTIARMRTDYVHEQQSRYRTAIADLEQRIASVATSERVKLNKKLKALKDQAAEIQVYEEKIHHLADQYISIDLDDGVKVNYAKFQEVLAKIK